MSYVPICVYTSILSVRDPVFVNTIITVVLWYIKQTHISRTLYIMDTKAVSYTIVNV